MKEGYNMKQHITLLLYLFLVSLFVFLTSCANTIDPQIPVEAPSPVTCTPTQLSDGIQLNCTNGSFYIIKDGQDGKQGEQGIAGKDGTNSIQEIINPCGENKDSFDEIIFKLAEDQYMCYFEIGSNRFLTLLTPGKYQTTDTQHCLFEITEDYRYVED